MMILFKLILLTVMITLALKIALSEEMILQRLGVWFKRKIDEGYDIYNIFYCEWCAVSLQSMTAHAFAFGLGILPLELNWQLLIRWPLVVFGASFLSGNLWNLYLTINNIKDRNEAEKEFYERCNENDEQNNFDKQHN